MNQNEIPTPRTDGHYKAVLSDLETNGCYARDIKFARTLERELAEMTAIAEKCRTRELEQLREIEALQKQLTRIRDDLDVMDM